MARVPNRWWLRQEQTSGSAPALGSSSLLLVGEGSYWRALHPFSRKALTNVCMLVGALFFFPLMSCLGRSEVRLLWEDRSWGILGGFA